MLLSRLNLDKLLLIFESIKSSGYAPTLYNRLNIQPPNIYNIGHYNRFNIPSQNNEYNHNIHDNEIFINQNIYKKRVQFRKYRSLNHKISNAVISEDILNKIKYENFKN